jgi:hypothetical protein
VSKIPNESLDNIKAQHIIEAWKEEGGQEILPPKRPTI